MSRSPLAYPLNRAADMDVGGAADLQTDVMRFMAILALCLVAIFALVQSIPLTPVQSPQPVGGPSDTEAPVGGPSDTEAPVGGPSDTEAPVGGPSDTEAPVGGPSGPKPIAAEAAPTTSAAVPTTSAAVPTTAAAPATTPAPVEDEGFTLRFASDAALMRSVAANRVGVYAIDAGRARRMTVSESRISFWDASTPNAFHEMEADTVPVAVVDALSRSGAAPGSLQWGVTLPGRMTTQLDALMREHRGGDLIIGAAGNITWEASR